MKNFFKILSSMLLLVSAGWSASFELGSTSAVTCNFTGHSGSGSSRTHTIKCVLGEGAPETCSLDFGVFGYTEYGERGYFDSPNDQTYEKSSRTYTVTLRFDETVPRSIEGVDQDSLPVAIPVTRYEVEIYESSCRNVYEVSVEKKGKGKVTFGDASYEESLRASFEELDWPFIYAVPEDNYRVAEFFLDDEELNYYSGERDYEPPFCTYYYFGMPARNVTVSITFEPVPYGITYNLNGENVTNDNPENYSIEHCNFDLKDPTRKGYRFDGWTDGYGSELKAISCDEMHDIVAVANWTLETYTLSYDEVCDNPETYNVTSNTITLKEAAERPGYTFEGWYDENNVKVETIPAGSTGNISLKAHWGKIVYDISYALNGGLEDVSNPLSYTIEDEVILEDAVRDGYKFEGWFDASDNKVEKIETGSTGVVNLNAKWSAIPYTVSYDFNGGSYDGEYETVFTIESETFDLVIPEKTGYIFAGWFDNDGVKYLTISKGTFKNIELTARWVVEGEYIIEYVLGGGINDESNPLTYTVETETFELADASRPGFSFEGWIDEDGQLVERVEKGSSGNIKVFAQWKAIEYVIVLNVNDENKGSVSVDKVGPYFYNDEVSITAVAKEGYLFVDWSDGVKNSSRNIVVTENINLIANFEDENSSSSNSASSSSVETEEKSSSSGNSAGSSSDKAEEKSSSSSNSASSSSVETEEKSSSSGNSAGSSSDKAEEKSSSSGNSASSSSVKTEEKSSSSGNSASSSSVKTEEKSSSSKKPTSSSSEGSDKEAIVATAVPHFSLVVENRDVMIYGVTVGMPVAVFDMQGRVVYSAKVAVPDFRIALPIAGSYLLRVGSNVQMISVR